MLIALSGCEGDRAEAPDATRLAAPSPAEPDVRPGLQRVVSLSPLATEFVDRLGAAATLIGVDPTSARRLSSPGAPVITSVDADSLIVLDPDLVLRPEASEAFDRELVGRLDALSHEMGFDVVEFAPHSLEDVFSLCQTLGVRLIGDAAARRFESDLARPLAEIGGASFGAVRPRVIGLRSLEPLVVAGGHSFETDLIEIAGGRSVTHGGPSTALPADLAAVAEQMPDLVVVFGREDRASEAEARIRALLAPIAPVELFVFDRGRFWLDDPTDAARRLRERIAPVARRLADRASSSGGE